MYERDTADCSLIVRKSGLTFPKTAPWLNWWLRPDHASMIFPSQRRMDAIVWDTLPDSTNAEEAMHFKIYQLVGKKHDIMPGLDGLLQVEKYHHSLYDQALHESPLAFRSYSFLIVYS